MSILYNLFIVLFRLGIGIAAIFNKKAKLWIDGRKNWRKKLSADFKNNTEAVIWVHCASLGEFEQGRPVIEKLKLQYPQHKILLTFFSPSGYEIRKNYKNADWVYYLPLDTASNAQFFIATCQPQLCIIIKYEYWYNFLHQLYLQQIPVLLVSAIFRKDSIFFKWYGGLHRKMLHFFNCLFVQNTESEILLKSIVPKVKVIVAGDTRFDTVAGNATHFQPLSVIEKFIDNTEKVLIAGSTWPEDEQVLQKIMSRFSDYKLIIVPHEIGEKHIAQIQSFFPESEFYTRPTSSLTQKQVLIINTIGILSKIYKYATMVYIGGGFNKSGIHNTLEAAVFNQPVITGPNIQKFREAVEMNKLGGLITINNEQELAAAIIRLEENYTSNNTSNLDYINNNIGATEKIVAHIKNINPIFQ